MIQEAGYRLAKGIANAKKRLPARRPSELGRDALIERMGRASAEFTDRGPLCSLACGSRPGTVEESWGVGQGS